MNALVKKVKGGYKAHHFCSHGHSCSSLFSPNSLLRSALWVPVTLSPQGKCKVFPQTLQAWLGYFLILRSFLQRIRVHMHRFLQSVYTNYKNTHTAKLFIYYRFLQSSIWCDLIKFTTEN